MNIWFGCTTSSFLEYEKYYFRIRQHLIDNGHVLLHDWLPGSSTRIHAKNDRTNMAEIYKKVMEAMQKADVLIVEDSVSSFSTGHQITFGLQRRKPTLVLWNKVKNPYYSNTFLHGVRSEYLHIAQYDLKTLSTVIDSFLAKYEQGINKHRFNLVIDTVERNYLEWAKLNYDESRTQIVRAAIREKLENDPKYQNYLLGEPIV